MLNIILIAIASIIAIITVALIIFPATVTLLFNLYIGIKINKVPELLKLWAKSTAIFIAGIPITMIGPIVVAIALRYRIEHPETKKPFTDLRQLVGEWMLVTLPRWALLWSNEFDGAWGDKRGWWNTYAFNTFGKYCHEFRAMWHWLSIRNPANYWSRVVTGCDVSKCDIVCIAGQELADEDHPGYSFLVATDRKTGEKYHLLQFWHPWNDEHGVWARFGWKISMEHNGTSANDRPQDRIKGSVYRISLWKAK